MNRLRLVGSASLIAIVLAVGAGLALWKHSALQTADAAAANQPEPAESVVLAIAQQREHSPITTSIGTIIAVRSITLRNELPGTVRRVSLTPGETVEAGTVLVALDVSVEQAELQALQAQADLAKTQYARMQRMVQQRAISEMELDRAHAEYDVALAHIARAQAIVERKTIRAPFRARVGIADVHPGQYLNEGTLLTTLQGIDDSVYVDFSVAQQVATRLLPGAKVEVLPSGSQSALQARILALDARVDPATRNTMIRARLTAAGSLTPGASVRVQVPVGDTRVAVAVPASAVRKGPQGDLVFVLATDAEGKLRAQARQVRVQAMSGDEILLDAGVEAGEQVAASGAFKLRDAALVAVIEPQRSVMLNTKRDGQLPADASF